MNKILSFQLPLRRELPTVYGSIDYQEQVAVYKRIDLLLARSGVEMTLILSVLQNHSGRVTEKRINRILHALRSVILMRLSGLDFREFSCRLADSILFQWFTLCGEFGLCLPSSKSSLQRYMNLFDQKELSDAIHELIVQASSEDTVTRLGGLNQALTLEDVFADCTCVKANIHFPTDWVLLVDAVKTLMQSVRLIREKGLRHRMPDPEHFLNQANKLAIAMSASRRGQNARRKRKKTLRSLKKLNKHVLFHAKTYRALLDREWEKTGLSRRQAEQILKRMDNVIEQLPAAIHQAHERIIGERKVLNAEKILSLYEKDVHVVVRGKAGAEVEFGNKLYVAEQRDGVVIDWDLFSESVPVDSKLVEESVERIKDCLGVYPKGYVTDRGFASKKNAEYLREKGIQDGMCARDPQELRERMKETWYKAAQKRRGSTEGRIGVFKNVFLRKVMKEKGFKNREQALVWSVLAHNLWVLARMSLADEAERKETAAKKQAA
jgi:hypothetical protein